MRNILFLIAISIGLVITSCSTNSNDDNFTLNISIDGGLNKVLYLAKIENANIVNKDSVQLVDGSGVLTGSIEFPEFYYLIINDPRFNLPVFVENGNIFIKADVNNMQKPIISGSASHNKFDAYNDSIALFDNKAKDLFGEYNAARKENDTILMKQIEENFYKIQDEKKDYLVEYIYNNSDDVVAAYLLDKYSYNYELPQLDSMVSAFNPLISSSEYVINLKNYVNTLKKTVIGKPFIDFVSNDPNGNPVALSSVVGNDNYVLVDFWASWCSPCRAENPNVVKAYKKYHDKGFDVFGVSFDKEGDYNNWIEAIKKDGLIWTQVSDLKFWRNEAAKLYGINSIPQNVLIDPDGIIIDKNLRGEDLQNKLKEIFN